MYYLHPISFVIPEQIDFFKKYKIMNPSDLYLYKPSKGSFGIGI